MPSRWRSIFIESAAFRCHRPLRSPAGAIAPLQVSKTSPTGSIHTANDSRIGASGPPRTRPRREFSRRSILVPADPGKYPRAPLDLLTQPTSLPDLAPEAFPTARHPILSQRALALPHLEQSSDLRRESQAAVARLPASSSAS